MTQRKRVRARKQFVLDTNVLLHDPQSLFQFEEHVVWLPVEVLEELDRFKSEPTTRGANAREVHRTLSGKFKSHGEMREGVVLENGGILKVAISAALAVSSDKGFTGGRSRKLQALRAMFPDSSLVDNRILAAAAHIADTERPPVIVVTKDLNMQLKARALGIEAQDYRTDRVEDNDIRRTQREADEEHFLSIDISRQALQGFASSGTLNISSDGMLPNSYVLLRNADERSQTIPARYEGGGAFTRLRDEPICISGGRVVKPANLGQRYLLDALFDPEITLVTVYGKAGTGKTLLSVGAALQQVQKGVYEKLIITRVIMPTGRDIGYLPGRIEEKMQPWVQPAYDALEFLLSRPKNPEEFSKKRRSDRKAQRQAASSNGSGTPAKHARPYESLITNGTIEIEAITHIRGRSIPGSILIVDEAQQLTPHEAKTIVTRMGRGSKLVLIGDLGQIDNPYVDAYTNGLVYTRNRLQGERFLAHVNLFKGERSDMADTAANLM